MATMNDVMPLATCQLTTYQLNSLFLPTSEQINYNHPPDFMGIMNFLKLFIFTFP